MSASDARRALVTGILLLAGWTAPAAAQNQYKPYKVVNYPLHLVDLSVIADTVTGLMIVVQPAVTTKQGRADAPLVALSFDPDSVLEWVNGAALALRAAAGTAAVKGIQWSRTLRPRGGQGGLALGRSRKNQKLEREHWLGIGDTTRAWQAEISVTEADSLLHLLLALGSVSRLDTTSSAPRDSTRVDTPVAVEHQSTPESIPGLRGRVLAQYVVGVDGHVERGSFVALIASDPRLVDLAWAALDKSTYRPAMIAGHPIRQLVQQVIRWH